MICFFDGPTAVGKTTQMRFLGYELRHRGFQISESREDGPIRSVIDSLTKVHYYKKQIPELTETFLWFAHYSWILDQIYKTKATDACLVDRSIFTPLIYQYILLSYKVHKMSFSQFAEGIGTLIIKAYPFLKNIEVFIVILNGAVKDIELRFMLRENRDLTKIEKDMLCKSIALYNNIKIICSLFGIKVIYIDTTSKTAEDVWRIVRKKLLKAI